MFEQVEFTSDNSFKLQCLTLQLVKNLFQLRLRCFKKGFLITFGPFFPPKIPPPFVENVLRYCIMLIRTLRVVDQKGYYTCWSMTKVNVSNCMVIIFIRGTERLLIYKAISAAEALDICEGTYTGCSMK
jgi:hypothetical protein